MTNVGHGSISRAAPNAFQVSPIAMPTPGGSYIFRDISGEFIGLVAARV